MSKYCIVSKKSPMVGNNVSHANNKTKRRFLPNLQQTSFWSNILNRRIRLRISTSAIRTIDSKGGFDEWILSANTKDLNKMLLTIKNTIIKRSNIS